MPSAPLVWGTWKVSPPKTKLFKVSYFKKLPEPISGMKVEHEEKIVRLGRKAEPNDAIEAVKRMTDEKGEFIQIDEVLGVEELK